MRLISELSDRNIGLESFKDNDGLYKVRRAARAILFDKENRIAILSVTKENYHKLPGGGFEEGEDVGEALKREAKEEVGAEIEIGGEIGCILEYRQEFKQLQISYCYFARVKGELVSSDFTQEELDDGFVLEWYSLEDATLLVEKDQPTSYVGKFINRRDLLFLKEGNNLLAKKI